MSYRIIDPFTARIRMKRSPMMVGGSHLVKEGPSGGGTTLSSLTVTGPTTFQGQTNLSGDVYLNRPVYFTNGALMIDPGAKAIYLSSIKANSSAVGSVFTQSAATSTALGGDAVATSTFSSVATATSVTSTTTATSTVSTNTTASQFSRTTKATGKFTDKIVIGSVTYSATPVTIKDTAGKPRTVLAYIKV